MVKYKVGPYKWPSLSYKWVFLGLFHPTYKNYDCTPFITLDMLKVVGKSEPKLFSQMVATNDDDDDLPWYNP